MRFAPAWRSACAGRNRVSMGICVHDARRAVCITMMGERCLRAPLFLYAAMLLRLAMPCVGARLYRGQRGQPVGALRGPSGKPMNKCKHNPYRMPSAVYSFRKRSEG